jgi:hypothetical protein
MCSAPCPSLQIVNVFVVVVVVVVVAALALAQLLRDVCTCAPGISTGTKA